jgi:elongation factor 1 alpha-like protein
VQPGNLQGSVRAVEADGEPVAVAVAGDTADVSLAGIDSAAISAGSVICHPDWPIPVVSRLQARVVVLDIPIPILRGRQVCLCAILESLTMCPPLVMCDVQTWPFPPQ